MIALFVAAVIGMSGILRAGTATSRPAKPVIAFFPLAGDAKAELRERCWASFRMKLDRTDAYEVIDAFRIKDVVAEAETAVGYDSTPARLQELLRGLDVDVIVWGEMVNRDGASIVRLQVLDLRRKDAAPQPLEKTIRQGTDLRFVSEAILQVLPGVDVFEHPSESAVTDDAESQRLWAKNPNLVGNWDFSDQGGWTAIYRGEKYEAPTSDKPPAVDKVAICRMQTSADDERNSVLVMNLSKDCAESNGMACLSEAIKIEPDTRYRLSFRYRSDGPKLHVFVKGYTMEKDIRGQPVEREIYRRQVPPTGATKGEWVRIVDDLNPQHVAFPVTHLRIDLYAYLHPGMVCFDDIILKHVGRPTRKAADPALDKPVTRPGY